MASASIWLQTEWELSTSDANKEKRFYITFQLLQSSLCLLYLHRNFTRKMTFFSFHPHNIYFLKTLQFPGQATSWRDVSSDARTFAHCACTYTKIKRTVIILCMCWYVPLEKIIIFKIYTAGAFEMTPLWNSMFKSEVFKDWKCRFLINAQCKCVFKLNGKISTYLTSDWKSRGMQVYL